MNNGKPEPTQRRVSPRTLGGAALAIAVGAIAAIAVARAQDPAPPPGQAGSGEAPPAGAPQGPPAGMPAPATSAPPAPNPNVRIVFKVIPPNRATVTWGKKKLGLIKPKAPLVVFRPRDSGPLDVIVRAEGCLPVHSRVYTFTDTTLAVRVTPIDKKNTLYGYREDLPPDADGGVAPATTGGPDGGIPAASIPSVPQM